MDLTGKPFEASDRKNNRKKIVDLSEENSWKQRIQRQQINISPAKKIIDRKKMHSNGNCWNFAKLELKNQGRTCSTCM